MERGVDLILMGAEHKAPLGEYQMGRLTQYVVQRRAVQRVALAPPGARMTA